MRDSRGVRKTRKAKKSQAGPKETPETRGGVLTAYINAAMNKAHYEILAEGEGYWGSIEALRGEWGQAGTLEGCRDELREVLEEWIVLGLKLGHPIPPIDGITITMQQVA